MVKHTTDKQELKNRINFGQSIRRALALTSIAVLLLGAAGCGGGTQADVLPAATATSTTEPIVEAVIMPTPTHPNPATNMQETSSPPTVDVSGMSPTDAHVALGTQLAMNGDLDGAIAEFTQAVELSPNNATAIYNLGLAYESNGNAEEAYKYYSRAIEANPGMQVAYLNRGRVLAVAGKRQEAIADFTHAVELNSKDATAWDNRGLAYVELGEFKLGLADLERAKALSPKEIGILYHLGLAYSGLGDKAAAIKSYKQALDLTQDPALHDQITAKLQELENK